jgi:hypothetical protein
MLGLIGGPAAEKPDYWHRRLLRAHHERPSDRRSAERGNELPPITICPASAGLLPAAIWQSYHAPIGRSVTQFTVVRVGCRWSSLLQCMSPVMCRFSDAGDDDRLCTLKRPAFEKRQGRKSRSVVRRRFGWLYGDLAGASGLGCVVMIHTPVRLDRDPAVNERVARRATRICGTSGCELSGSRRAWALSAASRRE